MLSSSVQFSSVAQSCPTLCDPTDCNPPGSSVHGIFQARILEWVVISSSRGSLQPRDQTHISCVSCTGRNILYHWVTWEAPINTKHLHIDSQVTCFETLTHEICSIAEPTLQMRKLTCSYEATDLGYESNWNGSESSLVFGWHLSALRHYKTDCTAALRWVRCGGRGCGYLRQMFLRVLPAQWLWPQPLCWRWSGFRGPQHPYILSPQFWHWSPCAKGTPGFSMWHKFF